MKIYKYRDLRHADDFVLQRLEAMIRERAFWCASPATLNDEEEFRWTCDFIPSFLTAGILAKLLMDTKGHSWEVAQERARAFIEHGRLHELATPIIDDMVSRCRNEIGLCCFGTTCDNETLWSRYAAEGEGICIEVEVPDRLDGATLRRVTYNDARRIHVDRFIEARRDKNLSESVYRVSLLSKSRRWEAEQEIRFVSKIQNVNVVIEDSVITSVICGPGLTQRTREHVQTIAGAVRVTCRDAELTA